MKWALRLPQLSGFQAGRGHRGRAIQHPWIETDINGSLRKPRWLIQRRGQRADGGTKELALQRGPPARSMLISASCDSTSRRRPAGERILQRMKGNNARSRQNGTYNSWVFYCKSTKKGLVSVVGKVNSRLSAALCLPYRDKKQHTKRSNFPSHNHMPEPSSRIFLETQNYTKPNKVKFRRYGVQ